LSELRFDGRVALITGGGRGIGRAYAELLAARGARVVVNDLDVDRADSAEPDVIRSIRQNGGVAQVVYADLGNESAVRSLAAAAETLFGKVDILIHNAGSPTATLDEHLDVHVRGAYWLTQALWDGMVERQYGRVLFTTSGVGFFGAGSRRDGPSASPSAFGEAWLYGVAKMGVVGLMRHLALRGPHANINVNAISPLAYTTGMQTATRNLSEAESPRLRWIRERCTPELVASVGGYLVHEDCLLNGEVIRTGGGHVSRIFMAETKGFTDELLSMETFRDNLEAALDETGYEVPKKSGAG
jgi:NAD(P)-dependent dehydrogenase (short-subunit alcohol dehydrogenase family)